MKIVGAHISTAGGVENAPFNASRIGAKGFALFTKNQRQWVAKPFSSENIRGFRDNLEKYGFSADFVMPHDSYLINLGHPEKDALEKSREAFLDEMQRCELLGLKFLNFHPGSHLNKIDQEKSLLKIAESINIALDKTKGVTAVIENTAGQGTNLGFEFEQLAFIIENIEDKSRVGVCFDTCHGFVAGYNIKSSHGFDETFRTFDEIIGLNYLKALHLNDAKKGLGSKIDRHESIGKGELGLAPFIRIMNSPLFDNMPLILETPDEEIWEEEIKLLYSLVS